MSKLIQLSSKVRKMTEEEKEQEKGQFEILAEWTVRRLRPLDESDQEDYTEKVKRWVLYSLGLDKLHQDIFLYLEKKLRSTSTEIAEAFSVSPNTARKYLDELNTVGLVDYVGREYHLTHESLSRAIELMLIPRITDTLRTIANNASGTDFQAFSHPIRAAEPGEVITEQGINRINRKLLEGWLSKGKRVHIKSYSRLRIEKDIDVNLFESVVERVDCYGRLEIPEDIYAAVSHKFRVWGHVETYP